MLRRRPQPAERDGPVPHRNLNRRGGRAGCRLVAGNEGGTKHERVYTVEGKENLTDKSWVPTNSASRFFRVKVTMP